MWLVCFNDSGFTLLLIGRLITNKLDCRPASTTIVSLQETLQGPETAVDKILEEIALRRSRRVGLDTDPAHAGGKRQGTASKMA